MLIPVVKTELGHLDGSPAVKVRAEGYRPVMRLKIPRDQIVAMLEATPVLTAKIAADPAENPARFVKITLAVQTDVGGEEIFEPVEIFSADPRMQTSFTFDLSQIRSKSIASLMEIAKRYAAGEGTMLGFNLIQQSPVGEQSVVVYDDLRLDPRAAP